VLLDHGYGFALPVEHESWAGGPGHERCVLLLCPNEGVAERWRKAYPSTPAVAIGCPKLDAEHTNPTHPVRDEVRTITLAWHWPCRVDPNVRTALPHYERRLSEVIETWTDAGYSIRLTAHPRAWHALDPIYRRLVRQGVISEQALWMSDQRTPYSDIVIADHTSVLPEAGSLGKRVLLLSAPWYDDAVVLPQYPRVQSVDELLAIDLSTVPHATWHPYVAADGLAAQRAADALDSVTMPDVTVRVVSERTRAHKPAQQRPERLCLTCRRPGRWQRSRCPDCLGERYGKAHQQRRVTFNDWVELGTESCARCGELINVGEPWDLDHVDGTSKPSHARCNRGKA
jgi:hypothetical protein